MWVPSSHPTFFVFVLFGKQNKTKKEQACFSNAGEAR